MSIKKWEGLISRLCKELAGLYLTKEDARAAAGRAGLDLREITFTDRSIETWRNIIIYAIQHHQSLSLFETCQREHPASGVLLEAVNQFYEKEMTPAPSDPPATGTDRQALQSLLEALDASLTGFRAQIQNRNQLYERVRKRLDISEKMGYEDFFATHFDQMNQYERRLHKQIRMHTDYIRENNLKARDILERLKHLDDPIPKMIRLRRHLHFWLNKYDKLFVHDPAMCLVYTGVNERVPFPKGVEEDIRTYLRGDAVR